MILLTTMGQEIVTITLSLILLMGASNAQFRLDILNSTLMNCALTNYGALFENFTQLQNPQNLKLDNIFSFIEGEFRTLVCRHLTSFDRCLKESRVLSDDILFQQYINYDAVVPTINNTICNSGESEFREGIRCARETVGASALCSTVMVNNIQGLAQSPNSLCPVMDAIFDCTLLQARQCSAEYAENQATLRNVIATSCANIAENSELLSPFTSKSIQCAYTLVGSSIDFSQNTGMMSNSSLGGITSMLLGNFESILNNSCNNIDQFANCIATEVTTPGDRLGIDRAVKEIINLDANQLTNTLSTVCTFALERFPDILNLRSCRNLGNVTSCGGFIEDFGRNFQALNKPSGEDIRQIACTPVSESIECLSEQIRDCNADIATLVKDTGYGLLRSDCRDLPPSSATVITHAVMVTAVSFMAFLELHTY